MPKLVPTVGTVVVRDGKRVRPEPGKAFNFTKDEADRIRSVQPNALRKPNDESADEGDESAAAATTTTPSAEASQAKARGGQKKATAAKSDEEVAKDDDL